MFFKLVLLFIILPLVELWLLVQLAEVIHWPATIGVVIVTGMIGSAMAKSQGWKIWRRINASLNRGELPGNDLLEGLLLLIGGALLITPGLITDAAGFSLLIPFSRRFIRDYVKKRLKRSIQLGRTKFFFHSGAPPGGFGAPDPFSSRDDVVDAEWVEEEPEKTPPAKELPEKPDR